MKFTVDMNVDRIRGRCSGQFDLDETDLTRLQYEGPAVLVLLVKLDELGARTDKRNGSRTVLPVFTPLEAHVADDALRAQVLARVEHDDQLAFDLPRTPVDPTEDELEPPDDLETYDFVSRDREPQPGDGPDYHHDHAAWERRQKPARDEPREPRETLRKEPSPAETPREPAAKDDREPIPDTTHVLGHIRGNRQRKDQVLARYMEAANHGN